MTMVKTSRLMLATALVTLMGMGAAEAQAVLTLDTITVLVTKARQRAIDALAGVSTVNNAEIETLQPSRLQDLFYALPGVVPVVNTDDPGIGFNIRGLQDYGRIAVVVDGARQNFEIAQHGPAGKTYIDPALLSQVEVARGPVSNIYGSGAIGGVVSLTTKGADDIIEEGERFGAEFNGIAGINAAPLNGSAFVAARPADEFDIIFGASARKLSDYTDGNGDTVVNSGSETLSGLAKIRLRPAEGHQLELGAVTQAYSFQSGDPFAASAAMEYANTVNTGLLTGRYSFTSPDNPLVDLNAGGYWNHGNQRTVVLKQYCPLFGPPPCRDFTGPVGTTTGYDLDTFGFDVNNASRFEALGLAHTFTIGADGFADAVESVGSLSTPDAGYLLTAGGNRQTYGAFAQWLAEYGDFVDVIGALRFDGYNAESGIYSAEGQRLSPKFTVGLTPVEGLTFYGTYAEGYRAPSLNESFVTGEHPGRLLRFLPNPELRPEVGKTIEGGVNARYDSVLAEGDQFRAKFTAFQNNVDDYISLEGPIAGGTPPCPVALPGQPASCYQYQNLASARIQGLEFEGSYDAGVWFAQGSATVLKGEDLTAGTDLGTILPFEAAVAVGARFFDKKLTVAPNWRYADGWTLDGVDYAAYGVFGLTIAYEPNKNTVASLIFDNIANHQYTPFMSNNPAAGFSAKASLKVKLGAS